MIKVLIPTDPEFLEYETQIKDLYEKNQEKICDTNSFDFIKNNTLFYSFIFYDKYVGSIYYFVEDGKLFLNGFSKPKCHILNLYCLNLSTTWFTGHIYAEAQNRASALCLLRCGFKRVKDNLFCLERN